ncbi:MAG: ribosome small subunit-dependent GTPase A [Oscillospiraceae bacterium]
MQNEEKSVKKSPGLILKSVGGLYFAETSDGIIECKARGIFRKENISPCAGDRVSIEYDGKNGLITEIFPRKNQIIRPPLANLDYLIFVISTCEPEPSFLVLDKFLAVAEFKKINGAVVLTKNDLKRRHDIEDIYRGIGLPVFVTYYSDPESYMPICDLIAGHICALTGNTGAGKSTLLNNIDASLGLETGEISKKLGRGRHTTRQAELFKLSNGGYIADTPGFSAFDTNSYDIILKDELKYCFPEFERYEGKCRFPDCAHIKEKGCAVIEAVNNGDIAKSRHDSYVQMYEEAKLIKEWEVRKQ